MEAIIAMSVLPATEVKIVLVKEEQANSCFANISSSNSTRNRSIVVVTVRVIAVAKVCKQ